FRTHACVFSPDSTLLAVGSGRDTGDHIGEIRIYQVEPLKLVQGPLLHGSLMFDLDFSVNGTMIAAADDANVVRLWDVKTGRQLEPPLIHPASMHACEFHPIERIIATSSNDGAIRLWDLESHRPFGPAFQHEGPAHGLDFNSNGSRLVSTGVEDRVQVWPIPRPAAGTPAEIQDRLERSTGLSLSKSGELSMVGFSQQSTDEDHD
ncbi:MAG: hypothetical protein KDA75_21050, partial [Planctomycetaceae bacterium]|nr:hypothetical protein [Planctomycetaceae bacterium]